jgi:hypothetical protein
VPIPLTLHFQLCVMPVCIVGHCVNRDAVAGRGLLEAILHSSQLLNQQPLAFQHVVEL